VAVTLEMLAEVLRNTDRVAEAEAVEDKASRIKAMRP
jgi:hypothetical protein